MSRVINRATAGANFGGILGCAIGTLLAGVTLALPGINIVVAPIAAAAVTATTVTVSGTAAGTLIGGTAGAISGACADAKASRNRYKSSDNSALYD